MFSSEIQLWFSSLVCGVIGGVAVCVYYVYVWWGGGGHC